MARQPFVKQNSQCGKNISEVTLATDHPTSEAWQTFRQLRDAGAEPVLGTVHYHYRPPGPTRIDSVTIDAHTIHVGLIDGQQIRVPLEWFPILRDASPEERQVWEIPLPNRVEIVFPRLNTEVTIRNVVRKVETCVLHLRRSCPAHFIQNLCGVETNINCWNGTKEKMKKNLSSQHRARSNGQLILPP